MSKIRVELMSKQDLVERVASRYRQASGDTYLTVEEIADICPTCAFEMVTAGVRGAYKSDLNRMIQAAKWGKLPKGWTEESVKEFWGSLTGDRKHKVGLHQEDGRHRNRRSGGLLCLPGRQDGARVEERELTWA